MQTVQGLARTIKESVKINAGYEMPDTSPLLAWIVDHAGNLYNFYHLGPDGYTPFSRLKGRPWRPSLPEFGENVEYFVRKSC